MAGKWEKLKGKFEPVEVPPAFQEKVDELKAAYRDLPAAGLAKVFTGVKVDKKRLEAEIKELNVREAALTQLMVAAYEDEGVTRLELEGGATVSLGIEPISSMADRDALFAWVDATGQDALYTINFQTLNGLVKGFLEQGKEPPPGVAVFLRTKVTCRGLAGAEDE